MSVHRRHVNMSVLILLTVLCAPVMLDIHSTVIEEPAVVSPTIKYPYGRLHASLYVSEFFILGCKASTHFLIYAYIFSIL